MTKPIIVLKAGRTETATFRRCGVLGGDNISYLFDMAEVLSKQPKLPQGNRLTILTNAGGSGVIATDIVQSNKNGNILSPLFCTSRGKFRE